MYIAAGICAARPSGCSALLRNEGGSVGTSVAQTLHERREQFHSLRLGELLDPFNPAVNSLCRASASFLLSADGRRGGLARRWRWKCSRRLREQQSSSLAYFDVFWLAAVLALVLVFLVIVHEAFGGREGRAHLAAGMSRTRSDRVRRSLAGS